MAAIDRTYITSLEQYDEIMEWVNKQKIQRTPAGEYWHIREYLYYDREAVKDLLTRYSEVPLWSTPSIVDAWLKENCPIKLIQDRLFYQYWDYPICEEESYIPATRFKILEKPNFNYRGSWFVHIDGFSYNKETKKWNRLSESLGHSCTIVYKTITLKKLKRLVRHWKLPVNTIIVITGRYYGQQYTLKVCY